MSNKIDQKALIEHAKKLHAECQTWSSRKLRCTYAQPEAVRAAEKREMNDEIDDEWTPVEEALPPEHLTVNVISTVYSYEYANWRDGSRQLVSIGDDWFCVGTKTRTAYIYPTHWRLTENND